MSSGRRGALRNFDRFVLSSAEAPEAMNAVSGLWDVGCKLHNLALATAQRVPQPASPAEGMLAKALRLIGAELCEIFVSPPELKPGGSTA